jgi:prepilin-type N-terminal cleavage/methylation domain-containing protein
MPERNRNRLELHKSHAQVSTLTTEHTRVHISYGCSVKRAGTGWVERPSSETATDDGFTLVETLVALGLVGLVAAFTCSFLLSSWSTMHGQSDREVAAQLASAALDSARAGGGAALAASPPAAQTVIVNGLSFVQRWSVTDCRQGSPGVTCAAARSSAGTSDLVVVLVVVQWGPPGHVTSERAAALVSTAATDPVFPS